MGYIASSVNGLTQFKYDSVSGGARYNMNTGAYAAGPTNPFGQSTSLNAQYSLFATYT
jgi:hypothetical protein